MSKEKEKYICTMDGYTADKPGRCPRCGMQLGKRSGVKAK